ncbi:MAG: hypothetical protein IH593_10565 [Bacteroidales bacterium]|nr:hypothetical protein [Bacteroidales bacterium]
MKKILIFFFIALLAVIACKNETANPIEGQWNLIYAKSVANDSVTWEFPGMYQGSDMKWWSSDHFIFVGKYTMDTVTMNGWGGGTYTINGTDYAETIQYHVSPEVVGKTYKMLVTVKNDTLVQIWPVKDDGQIDKSTYTLERYVRMK